MPITGIYIQNSACICTDLVSCTAWSMALNMWFSKLDDFIKCTTWDCSKTFKDYHWPNKTWEVVSFENTSLNHVTSFPALSIKKLIFFRNKIQKIDGKSFKNLTDLIELDFTHNELTPENLHPNAFEVRFYKIANYHWIFFFNLTTFVPNFFYKTILEEFSFDRNLIPLKNH